MNGYSNDLPNTSRAFEPIARSYDMRDFQPNPPLTKQVNQLAYELPQNKYAKNPWSYGPEFLKVFGDIRMGECGRAIFDCVLLGSPRPKVCWLFNDEKLWFDDVSVEDTADLCRLTIPVVQPHHYGVYTVLAEVVVLFVPHLTNKSKVNWFKNEVGRAVATATLLPLSYHQQNQSQAVQHHHYL